jgi:predicted amidophosphoribosyltransferase
MRQMIQRFKFGGAHELDGLLGSWLLRAARQAPWVQYIDLITPVPMHWLSGWVSRSKPAEALCRSVARGLCRRSRQVVRRWRRDAHQMDVPYVRRARNVRGAFWIPRPSRVAGLRIAVVDDVMTSGSTLDEVARVLKGAGALFVGNLVLARGGPAGE